MRILLKTISVLLILIMSLSVIGCSNEPSETPQSNEDGLTNESSRSDEDELTEAQLKELLIDSTDNEILSFQVGDFDKSGNLEAFAFIESSKGEEGTSGDIWFVDGHGAELVKKDAGYYMEEMENCDVGSQLILVCEVHFGGSGSTSLVWTLKDNNPVEIKNDFVNLEHASDSDFYTYNRDSDEYDDYPDSIGHTYKRYYVYWNEDGFKEYKGEKISQTKLLKYDGSKEILNTITKYNGTVTDIIKRDNGIININFKIENRNKNFTLQITEDEVSLVKADPIYVDMKNDMGGEAEGIEEIDAYSYDGVYEVTRPN